MSVNNNLANFGSTMNTNGTNYNVGGYPWFQGALNALAAGQGNQILTFYSEGSNGFTVTTNRITVQTTGRYHIHAQCLINVAGNGLYLQIRKNGVTFKHAYSTLSGISDLNVSTLLTLNAGDYIDFYLQGTIGTGGQTWTDAHSSVFMHWLG